MAIPLGLNPVRRPRSGAVALLITASLLVGACGSDGDSGGGSGSASDSVGSSGRPAASSTTGPASSSTTVADASARFTLELEDTTRATGTPGDTFFAPTRRLPTDVYLPRSAVPAPLIVLAHGSDGAPGKFTELLQGWADAGFVVAAPRFPATSTVASGGAGSAGVTDYQGQPADVSFVIDRLLADGRAGERIDPDRIGVAGLSLGGGTVWGLIANECCRDDRIKAAALFDAIQTSFGPPFGAVSVPLLNIHIDTDIVLPYEQARAQYAAVAGDDTWLITLAGGIHAEPYENTPSVHDETVAKATKAFWELFLGGDAAARARLEAAGSVPGEARIEPGVIDEG